jgi:hypothetical protein
MSGLRRTTVPKRSPRRSKRLVGSAVWLTYVDSKLREDIEAGSAELLAALHDEHPRQLRQLAAHLRARGVRSPAFEGESL